MNTLNILHDQFFILLLLGAMLWLALPLRAHAFDWVPTDEEIKKYRQSWNPFSEGPLLIQSIDIHPEGQLSVRPFLFSQISEKSYGNTLYGRRPKCRRCDLPNFAIQWYWSKTGKVIMR